MEKEILHTYEFLLKPVTYQLRYFHEWLKCDDQKIFWDDHEVQIIGHDDNQNWKTMLKIQIIETGEILVVDMSELRYF